MVAWDCCLLLRSGKIVIIIISISQNSSCGGFAAADFSVLVLVIDDDAHQWLRGQQLLFDHDDLIGAVKELRWLIVIFRGYCLLWGVTGLRSSI